MDDLYDASIFVADPTAAGTGPGGTRILSAARLTGKGTCNVAGFVSIEDELQFLTCVDATMNITNVSASGSKQIVAKALKRMTRSAAQQDQRLNLAQLAAMQAVAMGADEVVVLHGNDGEFETYIRPGSRIKPEDSCSLGEVEVTGDRMPFDLLFFYSICERLGALTPSVNLDISKLNDSAIAWGQKPAICPKTVVFGGELQTVQLIAEGIGTLWNTCGSQLMGETTEKITTDQMATALAVVNLRSDDNELKDRQFRVTGGKRLPITTASGIGILRELAAWAAR